MSLLCGDTNSRSEDPQGRHRHGRLHYDITERRRIDEQLRAREAELRAIVDNAPLGIFLKDREGRFRMVNPAYAQMFAIRPEDMVGRTPFDLLPAATSDRSPPTAS